MNIRPIATYPDPRLRQVCIPVIKVDDRVRSVAASMVSALDASTGVALAANQLGESDRIIVYDARREKGKGNWKVLVNPRITDRTGERLSKSEGCKSFPGLRLNIPRSERIKVEGLDLQGREVVVEAEGFEAAVIQHELDHLDGRLLIDGVPEADRQRAAWYADDLARINGRLSGLRAKLEGFLFFRITGHNGVLVIKQDSQIRLHFVDRWRVHDREAFLKKLSRGRNAKLSGIMSRIDLLDPVNLLGVYTQAMMLTLAWVPKPRRVYMLGLGGGRIPMVFRHYFPEVVVDGSELDGEVVAIAREYFAMETDDMMKVTTGDGRAHLASVPAGTTFDILMIDCFSGSGAHPDELSTTEFYSLCKSRLAAGGVVATNLIESDPKYRQKAEWFRSSFLNSYDFRHDHAHVLFGTDGEALTLEQLVARAADLEAQHAFQFPLGARATLVSRLDAIQGR